MYISDLGLLTPHRSQASGPTALLLSVDSGGATLPFPFRAPASPKWILGRVGSDLEALALGAGGDGGANQNAAEQYVCSDMEADSTVASSGSSSFLLTLCPPALLCRRSLLLVLRPADATHQHKR